MAHPRANRSRHGHRGNATGRGSGNVAAPTGGKYPIGNSTYGYGPTGTGFVTGTSIVVPTKIAAESPVDTAISPESDGSCVPGSGSTTTIYSTDVVTMTVTAEQTTTVRNPSAPFSNLTPSYGVSNMTATGTGGVAPSSIVSPSGTTSYPPSNLAPTSSSTISLDESTVEVISIPSTETSSAVSYESSAESISDITSTTSAAPVETSESPVEVISIPSTETSSAVSYESSAESISDITSTTSAAPVETSESSVESSDDSYPSSSMQGPGAFYQVSSAASATPTPAAPSMSYGTSKRGLAYNSAALTGAFAGQAMSWAYNWGDRPDGTLAPGIEFVPMLWGEKKFGNWEASAKSALAAGAKHLLSFNEPDLAEQANMNTATAAAAHIKYMNPYAGQAKIGSPAVTNGGPSGGTDGMGLGWLRKFFDRCNGNCKVDFVAFHWYDSADNVAYFKNYVSDVIKLAQEKGVQKVWLTEFAAAGSDAQIAKFLAEVLPWMDSNDAIERYAYFMCSDGRLVNGNSLTAVGKAYAG
ncbi:hypothetical protein EPUS_01730 [Endocarpon pusillum Z07020]|uniref:Asl1-like glycosyl hydrolase catalytic domain-containing protein n=1 Tax=Endocarpon pusillum (strain Z07020 / HMAS-L-300199) TaxID=1263415 RepID=U1HN89_ENDPU|nr:uncharacterized protein EPUS_01730 [Endocarpon pusillum Z07020]ERF71815.1 hypothetical protein EPUS_01730 [Endocarpon pusillum Z07020]